jgi:hypothetical protein
VIPLPGKWIVSLILTIGFVLTMAGFCQASGVTFNGDLESDLIYMSLKDPAIPAPETIFDNTFNLKVEFNQGEKQSGVVLLQYKYAIPPNPDLTGSLVINQAYINLQLGNNSLLRAGRQKITWGTGLAWNPTNYIGADKNRADLTTTYPGVDVIDYEVAWGNTSGVLLLKPSLLGRLNDWGRAAKLAFQAFHSDFSISAYQQGDANAYGADFATTVGNFTVYTELAEKTGRMFYINSSSSLVYRPVDQHYLHGVIGAIGNCGDNWVVQLEYYYNQEGWDNAEAQNYYAYLSGHSAPSEIANFFADERRNYLFTMIRKGEILEDLTLTTSVLWNIDDQSFFISPMLDYQLSQNVMLTLMMYYYGGSAASEFGSQSYTCQYIGRLTLSF